MTKEYRIMVSFDGHYTWKENVHDHFIPNDFSACEQTFVMLILDNIFYIALLKEGKK